MELVSIALVILALAEAMTILVYHNDRTKLMRRMSHMVNSPFKAKNGSLVITIDGKTLKELLNDAKEEKN